jgi:two-component system sensor histidine kinase AlgZ
MQEASEKSNLQAASFLPDFCRIRLTLAVVIAAELLAIVLCIARFITLENFWSELSMLSLYIQWVALPSSAGLCLLKPWLSRQSVLHASLVAMSLLLSVTLLVGLVAYDRVLALQSPLDEVSFLVQSLGISFLVGLMALHYFYLQYQLTLQQQAEANARFEALQARIRPHFLFNSMNTIASLTRSDPEMAENVVVDLAGLFRAAISAGDRRTTLADEIELARGYLNIEQMRLGQRLSVVWQIDESLLDVVMPSMMLQPLVENAVYHGIEPVERGGRIEIKVYSCEASVCIEVSNSLPADDQNHQPQQRQGNRQAQENIRQRLEGFYGEEAHFQAWQKDRNYHVRLQFRKQDSA